MCKKKKPAKKVKHNDRRAISKADYEKLMGRKTKTIVMRWDNGKKVTAAQKKKLGI